MCFIGLIGKEQLPCCISTIFLSSTALAGEAVLCAVKGALAVPFFLLRMKVSVAGKRCKYEQNTVMLNNRVSFCLSRVLYSQCFCVQTGMRSGT